MKHPLRELKGVGEKTEKLFQKVNIWDTEDLLHYYPRTYDTYEEPCEISQIREGETAAIQGVVTTAV